MLVFRRQSRSTGHRCEGPQIYDMSTDVCTFIKAGLRCLKKVKRVNRGCVTHYTIKLTLGIRTIVI